MIALVGYTGFVGSNIYETAGSKINAVYNSQNIENAYGTEPDILIYAGVRAEKFLANNAPEKDLQQIEQAERNIELIKPKRLVLISTIDVFKCPVEVTEESGIDINGLHAYGYNRYLLECWVREQYKDALIIRLPGLFGRNIKKNFIYDFINIIPNMLSSSKYDELVVKKPELANYYYKRDNGFYQAEVAETDREKLKKIFSELGFSALNFTDSRSEYQFYNLRRLWDDILVALDNNIKLLHLATEPISASELYEYLSGGKFVNELNNSPAKYNYKTVYDHRFGGTNGYISKKDTVLSEIKEFVNGPKI